MSKSKNILLTIAAALAFITVLVFILWKISSPPSTEEPEATQSPPSDAAETVRPEDIYDTQGSFIPDESFDQENPDIKDSSTYRNDGTFQCQFPSGGILSVGVQTNSDMALYINPHYTCTEDERVLGQDMTQFGFYITADSGDIQHSSSVSGSAVIPENYNEPDLLISDRTYDTLCPITYKDSIDYGIRWTGNLFYKADARLTIRVVRFPDGYLMGIAHADVIYDQNADTYSISDLYLADVSATGELSDSDRKDLVDRAIAFLMDTSRSQSFAFGDSYWDDSAAKAVVVKDGPFFSRLYSASVEVVARGHYSNCDVYAVNLNQIGAGVITVYFAPQMHLWGLEGPINPKTGTLDLQIIGYDPLYPYSKEELLVAEYDKDIFFN